MAKVMHCRTDCQNQGRKLIYYKYLGIYTLSDSQSLNPNILPQINTQHTKASIIFAGLKQPVQADLDNLPM